MGRAQLEGFDARLGAAQFVGELSAVRGCFVEGLLRPRGGLSGSGCRLVEAGPVCVEPRQGLFGPGQLVAGGLRIVCELVPGGSAVALFAVDVLQRALGDVDV